MVGNLPLHLASLFFSASPTQADVIKVELYDHILGPAMKTQSIRLESDGRVIEERYDFTTSQSDPHTEVVVCTHSPDGLDHVVAQAVALVDGLPRVIDKNTPTPVDGPSKMILVVQSGRRQKSLWYLPTGHDLSQQAKRFVRAWDGVKSLLLSCRRA